MSPNIKIILFGMYSYICYLSYILLNLMPFFIRMPFYKLFFHQIGRNVYIDYGCDFRYPSKIKIGNHVSINRGCKFFGSYFARHAFIEIGNYVAFGPEVCIFSAGHDYSTIDLTDIGKSVIIQDYVWVGGRAILLPGVTLGEGCVIGAGSVVTKDVPPWSIAVGNPARVIKQRECGRCGPI